MNISIAITLYILITTVSPFKVESNDTIEIQSNTDYFDLKKAIEVFVGDESEDRVTSKNYTSYSPGLLDLTKESHWFRVPLENSSSDKTELLISTFFLDSIVVYRESNDSLKLISANNGYLVDVPERAYNFYQTSIIPLTLPPNSSDNYYFHVINRTQSGRGAIKSSMRMGFIGYTATGFNKWYGWGMSFNFFMAGIMLIISIFNFTLYVISRERNYFLLSFNNLAYLIWVGVFGGMLIYFDLLDDLELERSIRLMVPTIIITLSYSLYAIDFLDFRKNFPIMRVVLLGFIIVHTSMIIPHLLGFHETAILISEIISPCIYLPILVCSFIHWKRGNRLSLYFFFASLFFNLGLVMYLFAYNSPQTNYLFGHYLAQMCFTLEVLTFSIITTQRFINLVICSR
jgi:hypothetical protein